MAAYFKSYANSGANTGSPTTTTPAITLTGEHVDNTDPDNPIVTTFVKSECYEQAAQVYSVGDQANYLDEIKANQLATLPAGAHVRWTAPQDVTLTRLRVARLGSATSTTISWTTSTGESGTDTQLGAGHIDINLGSIALATGDTIDFTLVEITGGQMQLATPSAAAGGGWSALQDYSSFAVTSFWTTNLAGTQGVAQKRTVHTYDDGKMYEVDETLNTVAELASIPSTWALCEEDEPVTHDELTLAQNAIDKGYSLNGQVLDVPRDKDACYEQFTITDSPNSTNIFRTYFAGNNFEQANAIEAAGNFDQVDAFGLPTSGLTPSSAITAINNATLNDGGTSREGIYADFWLSIPPSAVVNASQPTGITFRTVANTSANYGVFYADDNNPSNATKIYGGFTSGFSASPNFGTRTLSRDVQYAFARLYIVDNSNAASLQLQYTVDEGATWISVPDEWISPDQADQSQSSASVIKWECLDGTCSSDQGNTLVETTVAILPNTASVPCSPEEIDKFATKSECYEHPLVFTGANTNNGAGGGGTGTPGLALGTIEIPAAGAYDFTHEAVVTNGNAGLGISSIPFPDTTASPFANADVFSSTGDRIDGTTPSKTYSVTFTSPGTYYVGVFSGGGSSANTHVITHNVPDTETKVQLFTYSDGTQGYLDENGVLTEATDISGWTACAEKTTINHTSTEQVIHQINGVDVYTKTFTGNSLPVGTTTLGSVGAFDMLTSWRDITFVTTSDNKSREFSFSGTGVNQSTVQINATTGNVTATFGSNWGGIVGAYIVRVEYTK